jgi:16S rRNA (guanine966-N2)-methyltransferase
MRIIAGTAKSTRLVVPRLRELRPTTDAMRETLFNVLADCVVGARFLDLFAGCGAVGLEALSRGARWCTFVDISPRCGRAIRENLERAHLAARGEVWRAEAQRALQRLRAGESYDVVFADPPYDYKHLAGLVAALAGERHVLGDGAVVAVQHDAGAALPDEPAPSRVIRFGGTAISLYW